MSDPKEQLQALLEWAASQDVEIRREQLGGDGGGICKIKGKSTLFVDLSADVLTQIAKSAAALARMADWEEHYMRPDLRALLEQFCEDPDS